MFAIITTSNRKENVANVFNKLEKSYAIIELDKPEWRNLVEFLSTTNLIFPYIVVKNYEPGEGIGFFNGMNFVVAINESGLNNCITNESEW